MADPLPLVAGRAAEALGLLNDTASAPAIGKMVASHAAAAAAIAPDEVRTEVNGAADAFRLGVYALARLKSYEALAASVLGPDAQPRLQWWPVAYALQRIEDKRALPALLTLAGAESVYTRTFAIKGLGGLRDPSAVPVLLPLIDASHAASASTIEAIRAMARIGDARGEPVLTKLLYSRGLNPMVRAETLLALGESAGTVSVDAFIDFFGDPHPTVRLAALQGFAKRDDDTFLTVLSGLDPDPHWSVRAGLATILGSMDAERALPRLTPMLADSDARVVPLGADGPDEAEGAGYRKDSLRASRQRGRGHTVGRRGQHRRAQARRGRGSARRGLQARRGRSRHRHAHRTRSRRLRNMAPPRRCRPCEPPSATKTGRCA